MGQVRKRIGVYLVLAIVCYAVAAYFGQGGLGFGLFIAGGMLAELCFWRHLYLRVRDRFRA